MENHSGYYSHKPGSPVMKPLTYSKASRFEDIRDKEQRKSAMAKDIFTIIESHSVPSFEALDILERIRREVISEQRKLDRAYYWEGQARG